MLQRRAWVRSVRIDLDIARNYFAPEIASIADLEVEGLVAMTPGGFNVTDLGRLLIRNIAMRFDAYQETRKEKRFSKTI